MKKTLSDLKSALVYMAPLLIAGLVVLAFLAGFAYETKPQEVEIKRGPVYTLASYQESTTTDTVRARTIELDDGRYVLVKCHNGSLPSFEQLENGYLLGCEEVVATPAPTTEPTAEPTAEPTVEPTVIAGPVDPYPDAPQCTDEQYPGDDAYHGLWNYEDGCYYTHTHGDDPGVLSDQLGPLDAYLPNSISYPWETHNDEGVAENDAKHPFYKWWAQDFSDQPDGCAPVIRNAQELCIRSIRLEIHALEDVPGSTTATHSFWVNLMACVPGTDNCGIASTGGHSFFGFGVMCPYKQVLCEVEGHLGEPLPLQPPYSAHDTIGAAYPRVQWNSGSNASITPPDSFNQSFSYDWVARAWGPINPDGAPFTQGNPEDSYCFDDASGNADGYACTQNGLAMRPYEFLFQAHGLVGDYSGFTDVNGRLDNSCTEESETCIPFTLENWPGGDAFMRSEVGTSRGRITNDFLFHEFDILFDGQSSGWAEWPN